MRSILKGASSLFFAVTLFALVGVASSVHAGSIILTGHDTDDHGASNYMNWGLTALINNGNGTVIPASPTERIGYIGNSSPNLGSYLGNYNNFAFYDLDTPTWTNAFTEGNSVLVIGSGLDFVTNAGSTTLNANQSLFTNYFNAGGNLFVNTHQGIGNTFYNFLPPIGSATASNLTTCTSESGTGLCMRPTAAGTASGLALSHIVEADITHNQFSALSAFTSLEEYVPTGNAITIALFSGQITGGGFTPTTPSPNGPLIPEPSTLLLLGSGLASLGIWRARGHK
jgi:hypothetical protein